MHQKIDKWANLWTS